MDENILTTNECLIKLFDTLADLPPDVMLSNANLEFVRKNGQKIRVEIGENTVITNSDI